MNRIILLALVLLAAFGAGRLLSSNLESALKKQDGESSRPRTEEIPKEEKLPETPETQQRGQQETIIENTNITGATEGTTAKITDAPATVELKEAINQPPTATQLPIETPDEPKNIIIEPLECYTLGPWPLPPPASGGEGGPTFVCTGTGCPPAPQTVFKVILKAAVSGPIGALLDPHNGYPSAFRLDYHDQPVYWQNTMIKGNQGGEYDAYSFHERTSGNPYTAKLLYRGEVRINNSELSPPHFPYLTDSSYNIEVGYKDPGSPNNRATLLESSKVQKSGVIRLNSCSSEKSDNLPDGTPSISGPVYICGCNAQS